MEAVSGWRAALVRSAAIPSRDLLLCSLLCRCSLWSPCYPSIPHPTPQPPRTTPRSLWAHKSFLDSTSSCCIVLSQLKRVEWVYASSKRPLPVLRFIPLQSSTCGCCCHLLKACSFTVPDTESLSCVEEALVILKAALV
ncbi:hypothetical protein BDZ91DRAFT_56539 [Kalaharituber pfeilii]|nr:hypothetical protein BDZ91DRAFT_56539 [Kalaharituber pfeilii]